MKRAAASVLVAAALAACSAGNQVGALQVPTVVTGTVLTGTAASGATSPGAPAPEAPASGAIVLATGKAGTNVVRADARGRFHLSLAVGLWVLQARTAAGTRPGPTVTIHVGAGQRVTRVLYTG